MGMSRARAREEEPEAVIEPQNESAALLSAFAADKSRSNLENIKTWLDAHPASAESVDLTAKLSGLKDDGGFLDEKGISTYSTPFMRGRMALNFICSAKTGETLCPDGMHTTQEVIEAGKKIAETLDMGKIQQLIDSAGLGAFSADNWKKDNHDFSCAERFRARPGIEPGSVEFVAEHISHKQVLSTVTYGTAVKLLEQHAEKTFSERYERETAFIHTLYEASRQEEDSKSS